MKHGSMLSFKNLALSRNKPVEQSRNRPVEQSFSKSRISNFTSQSNNSVIVQDAFYPNNYNFSYVSKTNGSSTSHCLNHKNKAGQYQIQDFQGAYCKKCAATFASKGMKVSKIQASKQNNSLIINRFQQDNKKDFKLSRRITPQSQYHKNTHIIKKSLNVNKSLNQNINQQKTGLKLNKQQFFKQEKQYAQKLQRIHQLIDDISIRDLQQFQRLRASPLISNQQEEQFSLFGRQINKQNIKQQHINITFNKAIKKLSLLQLAITNIKNSDQKNKNYGSNLQQAIHPSVSSIKTRTQGSNKSYQDLKSKISKKTSQNCKKSQNSSNDIQTYRLSVNENKYKPMKQNLSVKTQKPKQKDSNNHCEDTPQSLKSKIGQSRLIIPKNIAITMFQKINICQSINLYNNQVEDAKKQTSNNLQHAFKQNRSQKIMKNGNALQQKRVENKATEGSQQSFKSSDNSKSRKSFNRYKTLQKDQ